MKLKHVIRVAVTVAMLTMLVALFAIGTSAVTPNRGGFHWYIDGPKIGEILAGKAGEETVAWEVPYLRVAPTLDGQIDKAEYMPFEMYEDYMNYMAVIGNTEEQFVWFYENTKNGFFDAYWGWDGTYMYIAFEVRCINGFKCTPSEMGGNVYLYAYNMLQVGIAPADAVGKDPAYVELGFGVDSDTGESLTHTWAGPYYPKGGTDFVGSYNEEDQVVIYEARIHLQTALGLKDRTVQNGDEINYGWLISCNGETSDVNNYWQVAFCHGIGGEYSHKVNQYLARISFAGLPDDANIEIETLPDVSEEDEYYGLKEFVDMSKEDTVKTFSAENASIEYITEGDEAFARITALGENPYIWSNYYPRNLQSADVAYIVVKYRASSPEAEELGILYRNAAFPQYDLENLYTETIGTDGEWHTVLFYMFGETNWTNWIVNMGLAPFAFSDKCGGEYIDIAFAKFYLSDPTDLYIDSEYDPYAKKDTTAEETTVAEPADDTTAAPQDEETTAGSAESTVENTSGTASVGGAEEPSDKGCASALGLGALAILAMGAVVVLKKKEN